MHSLAGQSNVKVGGTATLKCKRDKVRATLIKDVVLQ